MDDVRIADCPAEDQPKIREYIDEFGGAIVLRYKAKLGREALREFIADKKANGYADPPHDFVWVGAIEAV